MDKNADELRDKIYDAEMAYEEISMLIEIIKEFSEYNTEIPDGAEKIHFLTGILAEKNRKYKQLLSEFITEFQQSFEK